MRTLALATALSLAAVAAQAQGIEGIFQTQPNDNGDIGMVQFAPCGDRWCGTLVKSFHADGTEFQSPNQGRNIVWDMADAGNGKFTGGKIWDPGADKTYNSRMTLSGKTLKVQGCVSVLCRSQTWVRVQ